MAYQDPFFLFQVAHFYNTIDQQMIPSQQAMMLEAAMAFEHLIKNPKAGSKAGSEVRKEGWWEGKGEERGEEGGRGGRGRGVREEE